MIDKTVEITEFIKKHYTPGTIENTDSKLQLSTSGVLLMLFQVFPIGSVDDFEMHQILTTLNFEPQKKDVNEFVWCLKEKC